MSVNILDQNGNLKKIAHGFSESKFNTFRSDVISNIEMTDTASKDYAVGDFLIMANGQLVQVTSTIYQDMTINLSNVRLTTVEEMIAAKADSADIPDVSKYQKIFTGTMAEWNQLTTEQKIAYDLANITDDLGTEADIVDAVTDGDMRAVTSNAVHDALESKISTSETTGLVKNDGSIDTKSYAEKVANGTENNLAGLDANGNLKDGGWSSDKTTTSATGNPISISGLKSNQLAINPVITFEPIQAGSGTPSPSNVRAISGYDKIEVLSCGKNIFDKTKVVDEKRVTSDGSLMDAEGYSASDYILVKPNTNYYLSHVIGLSTFYSCAIYTKSKSFIEIKNVSGGDDANGLITTSVNAAYIRINMKTVNKDIVQIELGNQATTYEPYHKTTDLSESLGQTVYGGTLDVRTGKFTVDRRFIDLGDYNWILGTPWSVNGTVGMVAPSGEQAIVYPQSADYFVCNKYRTAFGVAEAQSVYSGQLVGITWGNDIWSIVIYDPNFVNKTAEEVKTLLVGTKLAYKLETPFTIQLTPHEISLLSNYAYVSTNGTSIALDYHNGELASLGDVSQLGETVNELAQYVQPEDSVYTEYSSTETWVVVLTRLRGLINPNKLRKESRLSFLSRYYVCFAFDRTTNNSIFSRFQVGGSFAADTIAINSAPEYNTISINSSGNVTISNLTNNAIGSNGRIDLFY